MNATLTSNALAWKFPGVVFGCEDGTIITGPHKVAAFPDDYTIRLGSHDCPGMNLPSEKEIGGIVAEYASHIEGQAAARAAVISKLKGFGFTDEEIITLASVLKG